MGVNGNGENGAAKTAQELLGDFVLNANETAFAEIVRRYGGMVFHVCLQVTKNTHDAEDATQAVFLTLAVHCKTGKEIRTLGPWLQQVAHRTSLDLRKSKKRRELREEKHGWNNGHRLPEDFTKGVDVEEMRGLMTEELNKLPPKYRLPLILHYFGGLTRDEMSRELNCKPSTLGVRLFRGREMLAHRLSQRGIALAGGVLAVAIAHCVQRNISESLIFSTSHAAAQLAAGSEPVAGLISSRVLALAKGTTGAMVAARFKLMTAVLLVAGTAVAAGAQMVARVRAGDWQIQNLVPDFKPPVTLPPLKVPLPDLRVQADPVTPGRAQGAATWHPDSVQIAAVPSVPAPVAGPFAFVTMQGFELSVPETPLKNGQISLGDAAPLAGSPAAPAASSRAGQPAGPALVSASPWFHTENSASIAGLRSSFRDSGNSPSSLRLDEPIADATNSGAPSSAAGEDEGTQIRGIAFGMYTGTARLVGPLPPDEASSNTSPVPVNQPLAAAEQDLHLAPVAAAVIPTSNGATLSTLEGYAVASTLSFMTLNYAGGGIYYPTFDAAAAQSSTSQTWSATAQRLEGWGQVDVTGVLDNSGLVIADGDGHSRTLDLSMARVVENLRDNPSAGVNGWYAQGGGQLILPPVPIAIGSTVAVWGEDASDPVLDLVNSVRMEFFPSPQAGLLNVSLLSPDRPDVPPLSGGAMFVGLWSVDGLIDDTLLTIRYDERRVLDLGGSESRLCLWGYDDGWRLLDDGFWLDPASNLIRGRASDIEYFAVTTGNRPSMPPGIHVVPEPGALALLAIGAGLLLRRKRRG